MKTISIIFINLKQSINNSSFINQLCLNHKCIDLYVLTDKICDYKNIRHVIEVHSVVDVCQNINTMLPTLNTDYLMFVPSNYMFEYDDAILDAVNISENKDIVCFSTRYGDTINKFDIKYKNYISKPSLSNIFLCPSAFAACLYSKKVYQTMALQGTNVYEALLCGLINSLCSVHNYSFVPLHILHTEAKSTDIDNTIDINGCIDNFMHNNPLLKRDYQYLLRRINDRPLELDIILEKIQKTFIFRKFLSFRKFLKRIGYYDKKASYKNKKYLQQVRRDDAQRKRDIEQKILQLPLNMLKRNNNEKDIIVSLTTHGKRLTESAPYGIYSLFTQTVLPNRIVINVNKDVWNEENLPPLIKRLMKSGLEVNFCKDIRSHTKFIPALKLYPNNPIITVDDDMCYEEHLIEELIAAYNNSDKKTIFCRQGIFPKKRNGKYLPYIQWDDSINIMNESINQMAQCVSPYGVYGVIYPPHVFSEEIFKDEIFLKLAPHTDDIWFWLMEVRENIKAQLVLNSQTSKDYNVSLLEYLQENESSALYFQNCLNGRNDKEMYALLDYYGLND